jgi:hypothetical protein
MHELMSFEIVESNTVSNLDKIGIRDQDLPS